MTLTLGALSETKQILGCKLHSVFRVISSLVTIRELLLYLFCPPLNPQYLTNYLTHSWYEIHICECVRMTSHRVNRGNVITSFMRFRSKASPSTFQTRITCQFKQSWPDHSSTPVTSLRRSNKFHRVAAREQQCKRRVNCFWCHFRAWEMKGQ